LFLTLLDVTDEYVHGPMTVSLVKNYY